MPEDQAEPAPAATLSPESDRPPKPRKAHRAWWCLALLFTLNKDRLVTECVLHAFWSGHCYLYGLHHHMHKFEQAP